MKPHTSCRICGASLTEFMDFGPLPLANALVTDPSKPEPKYPLTVCFCDRCGLVQLGQVVEFEELYTKAYPFQTGSSARMVEHYARQINDHAPQDGLVVDIGCNDCSHWGALRLGGFDIIGIDPCAPTTHLRGLTYRCDFGEHMFPNYLKDGTAHLIVANNVLGHVDDLHGFMRCVKRLLHPEGLFVFEVPKLGDIIARGDFSYFYHEHLSCFSIKPLVNLMHRHGLELVTEKSRRFDVHGGSIRVVAKHGTEWRCPTDDNYPRSLKHSAGFWRDRLKFKLADLTARGKRIIGYCASAKGAMILNWCGIGTDLVEYVIDNTPAKIGKYMPGTHQQIIAQDQAHCCGTICNDAADAILVLSANHIDEIKAKHPDFRGEWLTVNSVEGR